VGIICQHCHLIDWGGVALHVGDHLTGAHVPVHRHTHVNCQWHVKVSSTDVHASPWQWGHPDADLQLPILPLTSRTADSPGLSSSSPPPPSQQQQHLYILPDTHQTLSSPPAPPDAIKCPLLATLSAVTPQE
jgi:hypothetical protein